jgi:type II secretory pathway component GspD/PulD (secretin)
MKVVALSEMEAALDALERDDFDTALELLTGVNNRVAWSDDVDWGSIADDAADMLTKAEATKAAHDEEVRVRQQEEAYRRLQNEEQEIAQQEEMRVRTLLIAATRNFDRGDYEGAEELARAVLDSDQHNSQALAILEAAQESAREYADRVFIQRRREEFNRWRNEMERIRIPHTDILTVDKKRWADVTRTRGGTAESLGLDEIDPEELALRKQLTSTRMDVAYDELTIEQVANNILFSTDIPVSVDPEVVIELDDNVEYVTLTLRDVTVEALLNVLVESVGDELAWTVRNGRVYITRKEKAAGKAKLVVHPIQDLTLPLTNFKGADIREIALPGEAGDDSETTIFASELDQTIVIDPEEVLNLVRENIASEDWDASDNYSIDFTENNNLLVIHTPQVQAQVAAFLDDLRAFNSTMVTLESRFFSFSGEFELDSAGTTGNPTQGLDNLGDGGGNPQAGVFFDDVDQIYGMTSENFFSNPLGSMLSTIGGGAFQFTILDDAQVNVVMNLVAKSENATEITAPMVSVFNTQRAFVTVVNQVSFVQGFEVDVATSAFIADPVIGVIQEGIVLDVRPTVSYDRKYITLDVLTTVAELERPFREITTLLGPNGSPVTFALPVLEVQDAQTTVVVPDGGAVVLGGFKHVRYKNRTAESPWFADIPFIGFFFREKGLADEVTDLIIVIRAKITDMGKLRDAPVAQG